MWKIEVWDHPTKRWHFLTLVEGDDDTKAAIRLVALNGRVARALKDGQEQRAFPKRPNRPLTWYHYRPLEKSDEVHTDE